MDSSVDVSAILNRKNALLGYCIREMHLLVHYTNQCLQICGSDNGYYSMI